MYIYYYYYYLLRTNGVPNHIALDEEPYFSSTLQPLQDDFTLSYNRKRELIFACGDGKGLKSSENKQTACRGACVYARVCRCVNLIKLNHPALSFIRRHGAVSRGCASHWTW